MKTTLAALATSALVAIAVALVVLAIDQRDQTDATGRLACLEEAALTYAEPDDPSLWDGPEEQQLAIANTTAAARAEAASDC